MNYKIIRSADIDDLEEAIGGCAIDDLEEKFQLGSDDLPELRKEFFESDKRVPIRIYKSIDDVYLSVHARWLYGQIKLFLIEKDNREYFAASFNSDKPQVYYDEYLAEDENYDGDCYWFDLEL